MARPDAAAAIAGGRYRLVEIAGVGGSATVYRAWDTRHRVWLAAKVLLPAAAARPDLRARFDQEARALARLRHTNVLPMLEHGEDDGRVWLITEWARCGSLADVVEQRGPLEPPLAVVLVREVLSALAHAHERQIIHRDVNPSNVLLDVNGHALLVDFGIARLVDDPLKVTRVGLSMGTLSYMAPEQRRDASRVDSRADLHAVGAVLYFLLTGRSPGELSAPNAQRGAALARLSPSFAGIVERATRHEPSDRYVSAAAFSEALGALGLPSASDADRVRLLFGGVLPPVPPSPDPLVIAQAPFEIPRGVGLWLGLLFTVGVVALGAAALNRPAPPPVFVPRRLTAPGAELRDLAAQPDGGVLFWSRSALFALSEGLLPRELPGRPCSNGGFAIAKDGAIAVASCSGALVRIDLATGNRTPLGAEGFGPSLSADGRKIAWAGDDGALRVADLANMAQATVVAHYRERSGLVLALSPNGRRLLVNVKVEGGDGAQVGHLEVIDLVRGATWADRVSAELASPRVAGLGVAWWDDDHILYATAEENADGLIWMQTIGRSGPRGEPTMAARIPYATINRLAADAGSGRVWATVVTEQLDVWVGPLVPGALPGHAITSPVWTDRLVGWTPEGEVVYQSARGADFDLYAQAPDASEPLVVAGSRGVHETWGQRLPDAWLYWRVEGGKAALTRLPDAGEPVSLLAISTAGGGGVLKRPPPLDAAFACSSSGSRCFVLLPDAEGARLVGLDPVTGRLTSALATVSEPTPVLAVSPDGSRLAMLFDGRIEVRDTSTGAVLDTVQDLVDINSVSFAPDGRLVFAHGAPWRIDTLDAQGVRGTLVPSVHTWVAQVAVSPDGSSVAWTLGSEHEDLWALEVP